MWYLSIYDYDVLSHWFLISGFSTHSICLTSLNENHILGIVNRSSHRVKKSAKVLLHRKYYWTEERDVCSMKRLFIWVWHLNMLKNIYAMFVHWQQSRIEFSHIKVVCYWYFTLPERLRDKKYTNGEFNRKKTKWTRKNIKQKTFPLFQSVKSLEPFIRFFFFFEATLWLRGLALSHQLPIFQSWSFRGATGIENRAILVFLEAWVKKKASFECYCKGG